MEQKHPSLLIIGKESSPLAELRAGLASSGFTSSIIPYDEGIIDRVSGRLPDAVLVEVNGHTPQSEIWKFTREIKEEAPLPVLALFAAGALDGVKIDPEVDDFVISPYNLKELVLRIKRLLSRIEPVESSEVIKCGDLVIDLARCEVTVRRRKVELTFKEYELLKFLASNRGRVYSREALLDKVWGLDYYGGDRTVDVHIRRLRSKIETPDYDFIETVRNIGYRFKKDL